MFLIKSCNQTFMTRICFYKFFLISRNKNPVYLISTIQTNNDYTNVIKFNKITWNSTQNRQKTQKAQKYKIVFQKSR